MELILLVNLTSTTRNTIKILDYFKNTKVCEIKPYDIQLFVNELNKKYKPNTVNGIIATLSVALNKGEQWELVSKNPYKNISLPTRETSNSELLSIEEISRLLYIYENEKNLMLSLYFILLYSAD